MNNFEIQASAVFGRLAALGTAFGVDLSAFLERLTPLSPELARLAIVHVTEGFDRVAVATQVEREGLERMRELSAACDPEQTGRLERLVGAETRSVYCECESLPGRAHDFAISIQAFGKRGLQIDLERLASIGVSADALASLGAHARTLGGDEQLIGLSDRAEPDGPSWTLHIAQHNRNADERRATRERIGAAAKAMHVTTAQQHVVDGLHESFAKDADSYAWLRATRTGLAAELGVVWGNVAWEHVVRMMIEFYPAGESGRRLGELSGAFGAEYAAAVELVLAPVEPPRMRVAATLSKGRTQS